MLCYSANSLCNMSKGVCTLTRNSQIGKKVKTIILHGMISSKLILIKAYKISYNMKL